MRSIVLLLLCVWVMPAASAIALADDPNSSMVLLCTQNGYEWVNLDGTVANGLALDLSNADNANRFSELDNAQDSRVVNAANFVNASTVADNDGVRQMGDPVHCSFCLLPDVRDLANLEPSSICNMDIVVSQVISRARHADRVSQSLYLHDAPGRAPPLYVIKT